MPSRISCRKKPKRRGKRLRDKKVGGDGAKPAAAAAASGSGLQWPEGARYLVPAGIGVLIMVIVGISALLSDGRGGSTQPAEQPVVAGKKVTLTCRVRFIDRRKSTMTLAHGPPLLLGQVSQRN